MVIDIIFPEKSWISTDFIYPQKIVGRMVNLKSNSFKLGYKLFKFRRFHHCLDWLLLDCHFNSTPLSKANSRAKRLL